MKHRWRIAVAVSVLVIVVGVVYICWRRARQKSTAGLHQYMDAVLGDTWEERRQVFPNEILDAEYELQALWDVMTTKERQRAIADAQAWRKARDEADQRLDW